MIYLDYAKAVANGYILNFFADTEEDIAEVSNGKHFITKNGTDYGVPQPSSTVVITMPDKTKKTYILNEAGEWQLGGGETDYSRLTNVPITLANLADKDFIPEANTYYEHLGETTENFVKGIIYLYDGTEYKAIDGSGSDAGVQPDYNQNDSTAADYIKNRPFYEESSLTEIANFKVISGNLKEAGSEVTVEYNGERFTGTVMEDSGNYSISVDELQQSGVLLDLAITNKAVALVCTHKKTYDIKSGDEVIFNGVKYLAKVFTSGEVAGKSCISDGEIDPETLSPISSASFMYVFSMADEGEFTADYYVIYKSTTNIDFNIKTDQQTIKTIDPKFIKDMYYETTNTETLLEQTFTTTTVDNINFWATNTSFINFVKGDTVTINYKGTEYTQEVKELNTVLYVGNLALGGLSPATNEPFLITNIYYPDGLSKLTPGITVATSEAQTDANIKVYKSVQDVHTIEPKYIKDMYYTKPESDTQKTLVFKGEINGITDKFSSLFEVGDTVSLKEDAVSLNVINYAKKYVSPDGSRQFVYVGNFYIVATEFELSGAEDTKEDYCCFYLISDSVDDLWYTNKNKEAPNNIEIYKGADSIVRIPEKYLPLDVAKKSYVDAAISNAITKTLNTEV
mgnify:CR=1 FL=1